MNYKTAFKILLILTGVIVGLFFFLIIVGLICSHLFPTDSTTTPQNPNILTKSQYADNYPYTIDNLKLNCKDDAIWLEDNNKNIYALNGLANAKFINNPKYKGYTTEISKTKPTVNDSFVIDKALKLCK